MSDPQNPYASPLAEEQDDARTAAPGDEALPSQVYRSTQGLGRTLRLAFWVLFGACGLNILIGFWYIATVDASWMSSDLSNAEMATAACGLVTALTYLTCVILYCKWKYRAYKNLRAFGESYLMCSPRWAAGYYFVPLMNLFRPFQVMRELYNRSQGEPSMTSSGLVNGWWASYLIMGFIDQIMFRAMNDANTAAAMKEVTVFDMWSQGVTLIAALLVIRLTAAVDRRQLTRGRTLGLEPLAAEGYLSDAPSVQLT